MMTSVARSVSPWTAIIAVSALAAGLLTLAPGGSALRVMVVLWFVLVCPGMTVVRFFQLDDPIFEWALAIAMSLALATVVGSILVYSRHWSASLAVAVLLVLTIGGVLLWEVTARRSQRGQRSERA